MIGWITITIFMVLVGVLGVIIYIKTYQEELGIILIMGGFGIAIISILIIPIANLEAKREVQEFKYYQELVDETYNGGELEDTAINLQIIEMNKWLTDAKAREKTYGIFSFYKNRVEDLQYIKLPKVE